MKNNNILPQNLNDILIGLMLGDGHLYKSSSTSNSRFEISFGKDREFFAIWVSDLFEDYSNSGIKIIYYDKSLLSTSFGYRFKTKSLSIFNYYHDLFYKKDNTIWKYKKIVPSNIKNLMNPIVLAYLIMTDGNFDKSRNRIRIYTNSYSKLEVEKLAKSIELKLDIYVGVLHDRKDQWILTIGAQQLDKLRSLVKPHFEPSMLYRLGY
jgi:hypothetical protein